jgi:hypothetical protein
MRNNKKKSEDLNNTAAKILNLAGVLVYTDDLLFHDAYQDSCTVFRLC